MCLCWDKMGLILVQSWLVGVQLLGGNIGWIGVAGKLVRDVAAHRFAFPLRWQQVLAVCREGRKETCQSSSKDAFLWCDWGRQPGLLSLLAMLLCSTTDSE